MAGVQNRVGLTATVIASMKNLKISGLSDAVSGSMQKLRVRSWRQELDSAKWPSLPRSLAIFRC